MARHAFLSVFAVALLCCSVATVADAARPSESLLPDTTKGFISVPDVDELRGKWSQTQMGQLLEDPIMQPFVEDLQQQLKNKLDQAGIRFGLTWDDLDGVYGGEVCLAVIQPRFAKSSAAGEQTASAGDGDPTQHAMALLVDVTDRLEQANALVEKVSKDLLEQGAKKDVRQTDGVELVVFTLPAKNDGTPSRRVFYFIHEDQLVAADHEQVAMGILARFTGEHQDALQNVTAFQAVMKRCSEAFGDMQPHGRWFVEPFGYMEVYRAASGKRRKRGTDMLKVLRNQGFKAIQGVGGYVVLATGEHELLHRSLVYAPAVARKDGEKADHKFTLATRMLDFPNTEQLAPQAWIPREVATYVTFNWKMKEAFEYSKSLVNELVGSRGDEDLFEDILGSIANDEDGPKIDIRKDLIAHLSDRATLLTDYRMPITPKSERLMFGIEVTDAEAVARTVNKAMESDPDAKKRVFNGHVIWEILNEEPVEVEAIKIDGPGFTPFGEEEEFADEEEKPLLPNSAITVAHGHLIVASHVDFVQDVLRTTDADAHLADAADYELVLDALNKIGAGSDSYRVFTRTDEAYRPTYELLRQGRMPEAETMLGQMLNRMLGPDEEGVLREQQIDGSKLPDYQVARRYLGPAGVFVRSEEDGWFVSGCLLRKDAP